MVTIKEIAECAGVSSTTVSNVIHGKTGKVSPETVLRIKELLSENNYVPRFGLSALTNRKSGIIGILINTPDFVERTPYERPFYGNTIGTLESIFREEGYYIMVCSSKDMREVMRMMLGWNVDGVISISMPKNYYQEIGKLTGKPVVSIDMDVYDSKETEDCYNVTSKDTKAGASMMEYLIEKGFTNIRYIANVKRGADYRRYLGANKVYKEYFGKDNELPISILGKTYEERNDIYRKFKDLAGKNTALFFSTDLNAVEAIGYYTRRGIKVPEDISIVGCDDDIYARLSIPRLTTIKISAARKAELAAEAMLKFLKGQQVKEKNIETDIELILRDSVR